MRMLLVYMILATSLSACSYQTAAPVDEVEVQDVKGAR